MTDDFLDDVDRWLGAYRDQHPSPLVLAGDPEAVDRFCGTSRHLERLAGRLLPEAAGDTGSLAEAAADQVQRYLRSRRAEAMGLFWVALATRPADVARGVEQCWEAAHRARPGMLLVEADFVHPRPYRRVPAARQGSFPNAISTDEDRDLVDDLLEVVVLRGGQLAVVEPGDLAAHGHVVLLGPASLEETAPSRWTGASRPS